MESTYILTSNGELYHYGIKGQKWGVRRYQNADGRLTPAGKKRALKNAYVKAGASKSLTRRHSLAQFHESKLHKKVMNAVERLEAGHNDPKYTNRQRAKDYETAIRGLSTLRDKQIMQRIDDSRVQGFDNRRLTKLEDKQATDKTKAKIEKILTDRKIMNLHMEAASKKYADYSEMTNRLVNSMANDSSVVYNTRRRTHATSTSMQDRYYSISNTDYKVRANTEQRSKSKRYSDPNNKKQYKDQLTETQMYYYIT